MNEANSIELRALCEVMENARGRYQMLAMMNTSMDPAERAAQSFEYRKAQTEYWIAAAAVDNFQLRIVNATEGRSS